MHVVVHCVFRDAAMEPMRECMKQIKENPDKKIEDLTQQQNITHIHFMSALSKINPSVSPADVKRHEEWMKKFGYS